MGTGILLLLLAVAFGRRPSNGSAFEEPDYQPGPVDRPSILDVPDIDVLEIEEEEEEEEEDDSAWLNYLDQLIADEPTPGRFYQIRQGDTMAAIAGAVLGGANTGSNRLAYIKCCTRVPWNDALYVSDRHPASWGTLFDVNGRNLSAAFLPRNARASQAMMGRELPPRTIDASGNYTTGQTGYFGLLWLPPVTASEAYGVACNPTQPPSQLMNQLT